MNKPAVNAGMAMMLKSFGIDPNQLLTYGENIGKLAAEVVENQKTIIAQNTEILTLLKSTKEIDK